MSAKKGRPNWSEYYVVDSDGNRVGIVTCLRCGAAVLIDRDRAGSIHDRWHNKDERRRKERS